MSGKNLNEELIGIFKQLVDHTKEQAGNLNQRMDKLADSATQSNIEMAALAKIVAKSEERRLNQQEGLERIGTEQERSREEFKKYTSNNDDRVMDVEKQNIELKIQGDDLKEKIKGFNRFAMGIISAVSGAAIIAWMVIK